LYSQLRHIIGEPSTIGILGYGVEGRSTYKVLRQAYPSTDIIILDKSPTIQEPDHPHTRTSLGADYLALIGECDIVFRSPGVKLDAEDYTGLVTSQLDVFTKLHGSRIVGITGTKGKSTTTALTHHILSAQYRAALVGNIGIPAFDTIGEEYDYYVCEYSCHQLSDITASPSIAVLLNLYPEHLDYYATVEDYYSTKLNIYKHQLASGILYTTQQVSEIVADLPPRAEVVTAAPDIKYTDALPGQHNKANQDIAATIAFGLGVHLDKINERLATFSGLSHRLEVVHDDGRTKYINDSISTTPQSTIAGIKAYDDIAAVLIGGYDRGIDYEPLISFLSRVSSFEVVLFSKVGARIANELPSRGELFEKFGQAVEYALAANYDGTVLMSPAAASYDEFTSFVERGRVFKEIINKHYERDAQ